jgi:Transposase DDE domain group 1
LRAAGRQVDPQPARTLRPLATRYHKISHDGAAIEALFVDLFLEAHERPPKQIVLDLDATDDPLHGHQEGRFFHGYYDCYCYLPLYVLSGRNCWQQGSGPRILTAALARFGRADPVQLDADHAVRVGKV